MAKPPSPATRILSAATLACALAGVTASAQRPARTPAPQTDSIHHDTSMRIIRNVRITCGETATLTFEACAGERTCAAKRPTSSAIFALNDAVDREARSRARAACGDKCGEITVKEAQNAWSCAAADKLCVTRTVKVTCEANEPKRTPVPSRGGDRDNTPERTPVPPQRTPVPPDRTPAPPERTPVPPRTGDRDNTPERTAVPPQRTPVPPERTAVPPERTAVPPERTAVPLAHARAVPERTSGQPKGELRVARRRPALSEAGQQQSFTMFATEEAKRSFLSKASVAVTQALAAPRQPAARSPRNVVAQAPMPAQATGEFLVAPADLGDKTPTRQSAAGPRPGNISAVPYSPGPQRGPTGEAGGVTHASVPRYVCCEGFSLLKSALVTPASLFAPANIAATLQRNEKLLVFDDVPVPNGMHVLVRVQRTGGNLEMGWFPLFWLYAAPGAQKTDTLPIDASYMMIASELRRGIAETFYKDCEEPNPLGGRQVPQGFTSTKYGCGEYPVGSLAQTYVRPQNNETYKYLRNVEKGFGAVERGLDHVNWYVAVYDLGDGDVDLSIPLYLGRRQFRSAEPYTIADLDRPPSLSDKDVSARTYSRWPPAEADVTARVHPMDWYFRPVYPTAQPQGDLWFQLEVHLPGVELLAAPFEKVIVLESRFAQHRVTQTKTISLGAVRVDEIPIRVTGRLKRAGGRDQLAAPDVEAPFATVEFTDVELLRRPTFVFPYDIEIEYYEVDGLHKEVIDLALAVLEKYVLKAGIFQAFLWEKFAIQGELETMLLKALVSLQPKLTHAIPDPRKTISNGCDRIFPASQKTMASPFFGLYQECRSVLDSIAIKPFVHGSKPATAFARVNEGGLDWSFDEEKAQFPVLTPPGDKDSWVDRPGWSMYRPRWPAGNTVNNPGGSVTSEVQAKANEHYWPILQCMATTMNRVFNYDPSAGASAYANRLQDDCLEAGVNAACKLYGEGDDLLDIWEKRWGVRPDTHEYTRYCLWARHLKDKDRPKFKGK